MEGIYKEYCIHNNPLYYPCPSCKRLQWEKQYKRYESLVKQKSFQFTKHINDIYNFCFTNPSIYSCDEIKVRSNDKFASLKRSNSQEELKKEYYKLAKKYHPDKETGDTKLMQKLSQLYELLLSRL